VADGRQSAQRGADTVDARALRISEERLSLALEALADAIVADSASRARPDDIGLLAMRRGA
jgi:hypothetical protein